MNLFSDLTERQSVDARSIMLWIDSLKYELTKCKTNDENEKQLKTSLISKLQSFQADALVIANHYSDVESAMNDPIVMEEILAELKA